MRTTVILLLAGWFAVCLTVAIVLADGQPRRARSTQFIISTEMDCYTGPCSRIDVVSATSSEGRDGLPSERRELAVVSGRVAFFWYAADGKIRYVARRAEGDWPDIDWRTDLWSMNRDGSQVRLIRRDFQMDDAQLRRGVVTKSLAIPVAYDTNFDRLNDRRLGEPPYVALTSPDGRYVVSVVSGIDTSRICVSDTDRWDPTFRGARCFGDGFFSLPVWVAN